MIFYTNFSVPEQYAAYTRGPFIFIRPSHKDDLGLLEHEKTHVRQFWKMLILHPIMYKLSKNYRLKCEVEAYRNQLRYYAKDNTALFAKYLCEKYDLNLTHDEAVRLLK